MSELIALSNVLDKTVSEMSPLEYAIFALSARSEDSAEAAAEQLHSVNVMFLTNEDFMLKLCSALGLPYEETDHEQVLERIENLRLIDFGDEE